MARVLTFATKGAGSNDETRIRTLLADLELDVFPFDRAAKARNVAAIVRHARRTRPTLIVMEGTGLAGGLALFACRAALGIPFVVSSGDAVGPFLAGERPVIGPVAAAYERLLYRLGAGFIGWTPYLVGRALTLGARRGVTAASFTQRPEISERREELRARLGIDRDVLVFGLVGALPWNANRGYCYGLELVRAVRRVERDDVAVLVVGDGSGLEVLRREAGADLGRRVFLPGAVPQREVTAHLAAMDVGSLPQSVDLVGTMRYTTKITEYATAGLPLVTGRLPLAYDLADTWSWRLPGDAPWDDRYVAALAGLMQRLDRAELAARRAAVPASIELFDREGQRRRVGVFIAELLEDLTP